MRKGGSGYYALRLRVLHRALRVLLYEVQLLTQDWGFRFEDVAYDKIQLWHGTQDKNAPVQMVRYMVERLPHSVLREFEGENHFTLFRHLEEIVSDLVPEEKSPDCSIKA